MAAETNQKHEGTDATIARLDERSLALTAAFVELKTLVTENTKELKSELRGMRASIEEMTDRINGDIDSMRPMVSSIPDMKQKQERLETRVATLENLKWWLVGASTGAGLVVGLLFKVLGKG